MSVKFDDFSSEVKDALKDVAIGFLNEAAGEMTSQVKRNLDKLKGRWHLEQKEQWEYKVDDDKLEATIGSPMERSIWTEFGTGEYAEDGKGRKGWWVYVKDDETDDNEGSYVGGKAYTEEEARQAVAILRSKDLDAHMTRGQTAKRPFRDAYDKLKPKIEKIAKKRFGGLK